MQMSGGKNLSAWGIKKVKGGLFCFMDVDMSARCLFVSG